MLSPRHTKDYLRRIGATHPAEPDFASLAALQLSHLLTVPFENLDIHRGVPIELNLDAILAKVINRRRGGYCYELNSAFGALLDSCGYGVDLIAARVTRPDGSSSPDFAHMALLVRPSDRELPHLIDVGFGDAFTSPIPLQAHSARQDRDRMVRLVRTNAEWAYEEDRGDGWQVRYTFETDPRNLEDFRAMNRWQQTSPESIFTQRTICSMLSDGGRVTISGDRLIVTRPTGREERTLSPGKIDATLRARFGIVLDP